MVFALGPRSTPLVMMASAGTPAFSVAALQSKLNAAAEAYSSTPGFLDMRHEALVQLSALREQNFRQLEPEQRPALATVLRPHLAMRHQDISLAVIDTYTQLLGHDESADGKEFSEGLKVLGAKVETNHSSSDWKYISRYLKPDRLPPLTCDVALYYATRLMKYIRCEQQFITAGSVFRRLWDKVPEGLPNLLYAALTTWEAQWTEPLAACCYSANVYFLLQTEEIAAIARLRDYLATLINANSAYQQNSYFLGAFLATTDATPSLPPEQKGLLQFATAVFEEKHKHPFHLDPQWPKVVLRSPTDDNAHPNVPIVMELASSRTLRLRGLRQETWVEIKSVCAGNTVRVQLEFKQGLPRKTAGAAAKAADARQDQYQHLSPVFPTMQVAGRSKPEPWKEYGVVDPDVLSIYYPLELDAGKETSLSITTAQGKTFIVQFSPPNP